MATFEKRKGPEGADAWRVKVRRKGYRTQTQTFERKTDAQNWANKIEADIYAGRHFPELNAKRYTLGETIDRYLKHVKAINPKRLSDIQGKLDWWKEKLGHMKLSEITKARIIECLDELAAKPKGNNTKNPKPRSSSTVNRYSGALSHCLGMASREWELMADNPLRMIKKRPEPRGRNRHLDKDEFLRLTAAIEVSKCPYLSLIVTIALSTGARRSEILKLTWSDVDFAQQRLILRDTKNGDTRQVPLKHKALELMTKHGRVRPIGNGLVFPSPHDAKKPYDIRTSWEHALKVTGIRGFRFHDLRHTAASNLAMTGATSIEIADILGHKTLQMVKRYAHLAPNHTDDIVDRMNKGVYAS